MPTVVRQDLDNTTALLTVSVTGEELKPKIDAELKKFRQRAPVKGFRPGQVPMDHVKRMYGTAILSDTINDVLANELYGYLRDSNLEVLGQPLPAEDQERYNFNINKLETEYKVNYQVGFVPEFEVKGLDKSQNFERLTISNLDELAEDDLQYARKRMSQRQQVEDAIQENDMVKLDARELDGDHVKEGGLQTEMTFLVKTIQDDAARANFMAHKKGDTIKYNARTLEGYDKEDLYRKYILSLDPKDHREVNDWFEGTITEVTRIAEAELNEEFYRNYFGNETINDHDSAIEELKKGIEKFYDLRSNALLMRHFQERLLELNNIELPEKFLKRWLAVTNNGTLSAEQIEQEFPAFVENLRWTVIRDNLKKRFSIEVTDEEVRAAFAAKVRSYFGGQIPDQLIEDSVDRLMKNEKDVEDTYRDLEVDKLFQVIRDEVSITDKPIPSAEFHKILDEVTGKTPEASTEMPEEAEVEEL